MIEFSAFEALHGERPFRILARHPGGSYLAMQIGENDLGQSAVWQSENRRLIWSPQGAYAMSWTQDGTQIVVLQDPSGQANVPNDNYALTVYSWPEVRPLHYGSLSLPMGWPIDLVTSPRNDFVVCQWVDQTEAGFEYVELTPQGIFQVSGMGYMIEGTNSVTRPVFAPDGQRWVCGYVVQEAWWASDPLEPDPSEPVQGGSYEIGALLIFEEKYQSPWRIPLIATIPEGWLPDLDADETWYLTDPVFVDNKHVMVRLPSGQSQTHKVVN